jgi:hypothetical protein
MKRVLLVVLAGIALSLPATGQEYGRGSLGSSSASPESGTGRAELPPSTLGSSFFSGSWGVKLAVGWAKADWSVGPIDGSDSLLVPSGSIFYRPIDNLDVNISALFLHAEDKVEDGKTKADMTRLSLGVRFWPIMDCLVTPYVGAGIGYYFLGGKMEHAYCSCLNQPVSGKLDVDNVPGAYLEGGVAWRITDNFFINTDLAYDLLLASPTASIGSQEGDFKISALSVNLGIAFMF